MSNPTEEIEDWFRERDEWLQDAARRLVQYGEVTDADINELVMLCKAEAGLIDIDIKPKGIPLGSLNVRQDETYLRLNSISNIKGINALAPRKPLEFGSKPLTIIYGGNGSGKSGYVRLLKNACGGKKAGKLLPNVFDSTGSEQSCIFRITDSNGSKEINWNADTGVHDELKPVKIYDLDCANVYVNDENEVTYEPQLLLLFTQLVNVCDRVRQVLRDEVNQQPSRKPTLPDAYSSTTSGAWYTKLSHTTTHKDIEIKCKWTNELEDKLSKIKQRLAEPNPADKAERLRKTKGNMRKLHDTLNKPKNSLSDEECRTYLAAKTDATMKRNAAKDAAEKAFQGALEGIGTDSWRLLWESARAYSEKHAYKGKKFPYVEEDSKCVLCQQFLTKDTKVRLQSFEDYVKGDLESQAEAAEKQFEELTDELNSLFADLNLELLMDAALITDDVDRNRIRTYYGELEKRKSDLLKATKLSGISPLPDANVLVIIEDLAHSIEEQAAAYEKDAEAENRVELFWKSNELEAQKWLYQHKKSVEDEVGRLKFVHGLGRAEKSTGTQQLSNMKSSLSEELITGEYVKRFEQELSSLGASLIKVEMVKTRASKGRIYHKIKLKGCNQPVTTSDVLSEGESRIVSLAGFLADITQGFSNAPLVFDDPISSLDQDFEKATVARLIGLCDSRQLIVFTHRLSLFALLEDAAQSKNISREVIYLTAEPWGVGEPGNLPLFAKKPEKALNALLNEDLPKATKVLNKHGTKEYDALATNICTNLRTLLERFIENDLLSDVVCRFRKEINTKKIRNLSIINQQDCQLFDDLMTKYSQYVHSQSIETPVSPLKPDELQEDMKRIMKWLEGLKERRKDA